MKNSSPRSFLERPHLTGNPRLRPKFWRHDWYSLISLRRNIESALNALGTGGVAVDVGAGTAPYRSLFLKRGIKYVRCDIEGEADVKIVPGEPIDLPDGSADLVISFQVLEHVWDLDWYLGQCHRLLKPDGRLLISTHGTWLYHPHPTDYRRWTRDGLVKELETRGFAVENVKALLGPLSWTTQFRALGYYEVLRKLGAPGQVLCALICAFLNARMVAEDRITPDWIRDTNASVYLITARPSAAP